MLVSLLLALTPWPFFPLLVGNALKGPFRRIRIALGLLWIGWIVFVVMLGLINPFLSYGLALSVAFVAVSLYWRGRETYGQSRGLPKGSLALSQSLLAIADRAYYLKAAERYGPIFKMSQFHKPTICVVGLERGHRLFREHRNSLGPCSQPFNRSVAGGFLRYMDDETHPLYASLFRKALAHSVLADAVPDVHVICKAAMETMVKASDASDSSGVSPRAFCKNISYDAFVRVLFGLKPGTHVYDELRTVYVGLDAYHLRTKIDRATEQTLERLRHFLQEHARSLIQNDRASSTTCTLTELHRLDTSMPDRVCIDNLIFVLKLSSANVASLLLWLFAMVGEHPLWMKRIAEAGDGDGAHSQTAVIDRVVNETLRLAQSEYLYRQLLENVRYEGMTLPKGWLVRLCVWESHRSDAFFEAPTEFDPDRFLRRNIRASEYAPFGYGAHVCNGIALTEIICRALLKELAIGFDWSISQDGPLERGFRHWHHWRPSSALRVQMAVRKPMRYIDAG